uniref:Ubiquitin-like domain-containing protein n=1 Tax=Kalanchoe fedtschenkoi TaxID=63787 RepID=A0A7N0UVF9_KALFE
MASKRKFSLVNAPPQPQQQQQEGEDEVTLHVKVIKTVCVKVKASERVENIKEIVKQSEEAVPVHFPELVISGNQLKDGKKLSDYTVGRNLNIDVVCQERRIKINVKRISVDGIISTGLLVKMQDTIKLVKSMIDGREGTRLSEYHLVFAGEQLQDEMTVGGYEMKNGSNVYMVFCPSDSVPLQIAMPSGNIERVEAKPLNTIFDLKVILQSIIDMPINQWHLGYSDETLEDPETVAYCGLEAEDLLYVMLPSVQIFVRIRSGEQITVFVKLTDDVSSIREKIYDKAGYPVEYQTLIFSGRVLEDGQRIISYGVQKSSTLHLSFKFPAPTQDLDN